MVGNAHTHTYNHTHARLHFKLLLNNTSVDEEAGWHLTRILSPLPSTKTAAKKKSIFSGGYEHCGFPVLNREHLAHAIVFMPYLLRVLIFNLSETEGKLDFTANFPYGKHWGNFDWHTSSLHRPVANLKWTCQLFMTLRPWMPTIHY